jgi:hypothetical protein
LTAAQTALAFMLIAGAGLVASTVKDLWSRSGFDFDRLLVVSVEPHAGTYRSNDDVADLLGLMRGRLLKLAGVEGVSVTSGDLLRSLRGGSKVIVRRSAASDAGAPARPLPQDGGIRPDPRFVPGEMGIAALHSVSEDYFLTTGTRIARGRAFSVHDGADGRPVIVIDEFLASQVWPNENPVGRCASMGADVPCAEIVGVSAARRHQLLTITDPEVFVPAAQAHLYHGTYAAPRALVVRIDPDVPGVIGAVRASASGIGAAADEIAVQPLETLAVGQLRAWRLAGRMFGTFGAGGIMMAAVGLYASLTFAVHRRSREIGLRLALGATTGAVVYAVVGGTMRTVAGGILAGAVLVGVVGALARSLLFGVAPMDSGNLIAAAALLSCAAAGGAVVPVMRAAAVDPASVLKDG